MKNLIVLLLLINFLEVKSQFFTCENLSPNWKTIWTFDVGRLEVQKQEDRALVGTDSKQNGDEPYLINIGFVVKLGENCSANTYLMDAEPKAYESVQESFRMTNATPNSMFKIEFQNINSPTTLDVLGILNKVFNEGLTLYGTVTIAMEDDATALNLKKDLARNIQNALQITLNEIIATGFQVNNQEELKNKLLNVMTDFDFKFGQKFAEVVRFLINRDDDIIGVHTCLFVDLPNDLFEILGISIDNFRTVVNTYDVGYSVSEIIPVIKDFKLLRWGVANLLQSIVPPFSFGLTFGGTGGRSNYNPLSFIQYSIVPNLLNPNGVVNARYNATSSSFVYGRCGYGVDDVGSNDGSFVHKSCGCMENCTGTKWKGDFGKTQGWSDYNKYPRFLVDINNDGLKDVVGFGQSAVLAALNIGNNTFGNTYSLINNDFCVSQGWNSQDQFPRQLIDINNDGKVDIVGFGSYGVRVYLGNGSGGFTIANNYMLSNFGQASGNGGYTSQNSRPRYLADIDGDGDLDIIGFSSNGVRVAKNTGAGFVMSSVTWSSQWCSNTGWTGNDLYPRYVTDINGDNKADIIGFGQSGVSVSLSTGNSLLTASSWYGNFGINQGYTSQDAHPRFLGDFNGDGRPDIVAFGNDNTSVVLNNSINGQNNFTRFFNGQINGEVWSRNFGRNDRTVEFGYDYKWNSFNTYPRLVGDINGDGKDDIIGFGVNGSLIGISSGRDFKCTKWLNTGFGTSNGWSTQLEFPRFIENVSISDTRKEIVGFGNDGVWVLNCNGGNYFRKSNSSDEENNSLFDVNNIKIDIFPNPNSGELNINTNNNEVVLKAIILNSIGIIISEIDDIQGNTITYLIDQPNGLYILNFYEKETNKFISSHKLILKK